MRAGSAADRAALPHPEGRLGSAAPKGAWYARMRHSPVNNGETRTSRCMEPETAGRVGYCPCAVTDGSVWISDTGNRWPAR